MSNGSIIILVVCVIGVAALAFIVVFMKRNFGANSGNTSNISAKRLAKIKDEDTVVKYILSPHTSIETRWAGFAKLSKPESFVRIARHTSDETLWSKALEYIIDDYGLCSVLLASNGDEKKALAALGKIKSQEAINQAALEGSVYAVDKVTDPDVILRVAVLGSRKALSRIKDNIRLGRVYTESKNRDIQDQALGRISDEELKAQLSPEYAKSTQYLLNKYVDDPQKLLAAIKSIKDSADRISAVRGISNSKILAYIAVHAQDWAVCMEAVKGIQEQTTLYGLFEHPEGYDNLRMEVISLLSSSAHLEKIARGDFDKKYRTRAANRYLSLTSVPEREKDAMVSYMMGVVSLVDMFDVLPEFLYARYGFKCNRTTIDMRDQWGVYDEMKVEYFYQGERIGGHQA